MEASFIQGLKLKKSPKDAINFHGAKNSGGIYDAAVLHALVYLRLDKLISSEGRGGNRSYPEIYLTSDLFFVRDN